jgi:hypothetical protein
VLNVRHQFISTSEKIVLNKEPYILASEAVTESGLSHDNLARLAFLMPLDSKP